MFETLKNILNHFIFKRPSLSFQNIKDYLPILFIIPTSLGGIWQLLELGSIGIPYIRFFSVTQLLPDGLVIIFMAFAISVYLTNFALLYDSKNFSHHFTHSKKHLFIYLLLNISVLTLVIFTFLKFHTREQDFRQVAYEFAVLFLIIKCSIYIIELIITLILKFRNKSPAGLDKIFDDVKKQDYSEIHTLFLTMLYLIIFGIFLYYTVSNFSKFAYYPNDFENLTKLENELIKNFRLCEQPSLEYFNKDYLFYNMEIDGKKRIYIIESKNLFLSPLEPIIKGKRESED